MNMMGFSTPCCKNTLVDALRHWLLALLLLFAGAAQAAGITIKQADLQLVDEFYLLRAELDIDLSSKVEDALNKGVPLTFRMEVELVRPRSLWFDETVVSTHQLVRLSYHALTRQYRLNAGGLNKNFVSLDGALAELQSLHDWQILERTQLPRKSPPLRLGLRVYLDQTQLPKPLQVNALSSADWQLDSGWQQSEFVPAPR